VKLAVMQPYLFPYIGYYQLAYYSDTFIFYDDVNYIKGGYINRNNILASGAAQRFTWSIDKSSSFKKINELEFSKNTRKILASIRQAYSKAPYFSDVFPLVEKVLQPSDFNVARVAARSIIDVFEYLEIKRNFIFSSDLSYDRELSAQNKLFEMCVITDATDYCNTYGGVDLYSKEAFLEKNVNLSFIQPDNITYQQGSNHYVPFLSIIDVLMWNEKDACIRFLQQYALR